MAYFHLASAIGGGGGSLGNETGFAAVMFLALGLCALGAGVRLLWRGPIRMGEPTPRPKPQVRA